MQFRTVRRTLVALAALVAMLMIATFARAQTATGTLRGQVTDPSGAAVPQATVAMTPSSGQTVTTKTTATGTYEIKGLAPGVYIFTVNADGFAIFENDSVEISAGQIQKADARLVLAVQQQKINVSGQAVQLDVSPENNAGAIVIQGKDLEALSDDPDELQDELSALAGPSAGPNGGQMYIDGFTAGQLPPKSSIREIRINSNPFSAEWDAPGFGRVEIFTKPGTGTPHGQFFVIGNDSAFNTLDPFIIPGVTPTPPYHTVQFSGNVSGPINKKISYFFEVEQRNIDNTSVVNAKTLDSNFNPVLSTASVVNPLTRTEISPRFDFQLGANDTLTARYQFTRSVNTNSGAGGLNLQSLESNSSDIENTIQFDETHVISPRALTETRFQYLRQSSSQTAQSMLPYLQVIGEFSGGGNRTGVSSRRRESLRTTELHAGCFRKAFASIRRPLARFPGDQHFYDRVQQLLYLWLACLIRGDGGVSRGKSNEHYAAGGNWTQPVFHRHGNTHREGESCGHGRLCRGRLEAPAHGDAELRIAI